MRIYYRISSGAIRDHLYTNREGLAPVILRWIIGIPLFAATGLYIFFPGRGAWMYLDFPGALRVAGIAAGVSAVYLILLVHRELGSLFSSTLLLRKDHRLIRTGPYRYVRHPMYSGYLLLFIAAFLISGNWVIGAAGKGVIMTLMTVRLVREERLLLERFGMEYENYKTATGMFIPMPHKLGDSIRSLMNGWGNE